jgi:hypothetical protein
LFAKSAAEEIKAITDKYQMPKDRLGEELERLCFQHQDLWPSDKQGSKAHKRSATTIHSATKRFMFVLSRNSTFAELLCTAVEPQGHSRLSIGDINTLTALLKRLLFNSSTAKRARSALGRAKDPLAVTLSEGLGQLYDKWCPPSPRPTLRGENRGHLRASFVHDALRLLGITLTDDSIRTYREKKHKRRISS